MQEINVEAVDSHVIEIESESLFPLRGSSMLTAHEAEELRDNLNEVLE